MIITILTQQTEYEFSLCRTIFLVLLFSQYARNVQLPLPVYKAKKGWTSYRLQLFKMFPVSTRSNESDQSAGVGRFSLCMPLCALFLPSAGDILNNTAGGKRQCHINSLTFKIYACPPKGHPFHASLFIDSLFTVRLEFVAVSVPLP